MLCLTKCHIRGPAPTEHSRWLPEHSRIPFANRLRLAAVSCIESSEVALRHAPSRRSRACQAFLFRGLRRCAAAPVTRTVQNPRRCGLQGQTQFKVWTVLWLPPRSAVLLTSCVRPWRILNIVDWSSAWYYLFFGTFGSSRFCVDLSSARYLCL